MQRRRRDARAFIYPLFICQRARYRRSLFLSLSPSAPGPAGDRFEKLLIVLFWKGASFALRPPSSFFPRGDSFSRELLANQTHLAATMRTCPLFSIGTREGSSLLEEVWIDGWRPATKSRANSLLWCRDLDWDTRIYPGPAVIRAANRKVVAYANYSIKLWSSAKNYFFYARIKRNNYFSWFLSRHVRFSLSNFFVMSIFDSSFVL